MAHQWDIKTFGSPYCVALARYKKEECRLAASTLSKVAWEIEGSLEFDGFSHYAASLVRQSLEDSSDRYSEQAKDWARLEKDAIELALLGTHPLGDKDLVKLGICASVDSIKAELGI